MHGNHTRLKQSGLLLIGIFVVLLSLLLISKISGDAEAREIIIDSQGGGDYTDLRIAASQWADGDVVTLWNGTHMVGTPLGGFAENLTIRGNGSDSTRIQFTRYVTLMVYGANVTFEGIKRDLAADLLDQRTKEAEEVSAEWLSALNDLEADPTRGDVLPSRNHPSEFRKRVGHYRVLFDLQSDQRLVWSTASSGAPRRPIDDPDRGPEAGRPDPRPPAKQSTMCDEQSTWTAVERSAFGS